MADSIEAIVYDRLEMDGDLDDDAKLYVMAALDGTLGEVIEGGGEGRTAPRPNVPETPAGAYLRRVSVSGFRGIGPRADLEVVPGPGLTLVVGANGTGKSSFAEGLEFLLTGRNARWQDKSAEWRQGWRNLHAQDPPELQASFAVDGQPEETLVSRRWPSADAQNIEDHTVEGLEVLEWQAALDTHRPFLSYDQLSAIVDKGPSARFDAMAAGLGLERLTDARERLRARRMADQRTLGDARRELDAFRAELDALDDERVGTVRAALANEPWDLDAVVLVLDGVFGEDADRPLDLLRRLATIEFPSAGEVEECCQKLRTVHPLLQEVRGVTGLHTTYLISVLEAALLVHLYDGDRQCPVCGEGRIDDRWRSAFPERHRQLFRDWQSVCAACMDLSEAWDLAKKLCKPAPDWLMDDRQVGIDASALIHAWDWWSRALTDEPRLPELEMTDINQLTVGRLKGRHIRLPEAGASKDELRAALPEMVEMFKVVPLRFREFVSTLTEQGVLEVAGRLTERGAQARAAVEALREQARAELDRRENLWRPLRRQLQEWLPSARRGQQASARLTVVQAAGDWLTSVEADVRAERFRPIADRARRFWKTMGKGSSVSLDDLTLAGQANRRHLELTTSIDGQAGAALSVMSQGELNALSLSLFLARALLPESPFRFLVIDDPVQAMDPTKVEGLARVLDEAARHRQVTVFTHDERLPAAARRLRIEHRLLAVTRRENSQVQCQPALEPVQRHLADARAVWLTDPLDDETRRRVIPGFCRQALEAACVQAVWLARTAAGRDYTETEQDINHAQTLNTKLALILLDDVDGNHQDMHNTLYQRFGTRARDVVDACNRGAHGHWHGGMDALINGTDWLAKRILTHRTQ